MGMPHPPAGQFHPRVSGSKRNRQGSGRGADGRGVKEATRNSSPSAYPAPGNCGGPGVQNIVRDGLLHTRWPSLHSQ